MIKFLSRRIRHDSRALHNITDASRILEVEDDSEEIEVCSDQDVAVSRHHKSGRKAKRETKVEPKCEAKSEHEPDDEPRKRRRRR